VANVQTYGNSNVSAYLANFDGNITAVGNVTGGNITTTGIVTATGNVTSGNIITSGNLIDTGALSVLTNTSGLALTIDTYQQTNFNRGIREKITVSGANATATVNYDVIDQSILYYTANATANSTMNLRGNSSVALNTVMGNGESLSAVFMNTNGATAYFVSNVQIDGSNVTPRWQGGSAPTSGNPISVDVYVFTVIKTGNAAFSVFASQTQFK